MKNILKLLLDKGIQKTGEVICYNPIAPSRRLFRIYRQDYEIPNSTIIEFKKCLIFFYKGNENSPERIVFSQGSEV